MERLNSKTPEILNLAEGAAQQQPERVFQFDDQPLASAEPQYYPHFYTMVEVRDPIEAVKLYQKGFGAVVTSEEYLPNGDPYIDIEINGSNLLVRPFVEDSQPTNGCCVSFASVADLRRAYEILTAEGEGTSDETAHYSDLIAWVTDKFGINWFMIVATQFSDVEGNPVYKASPRKSYHPTKPEANFAELPAERFTQPKYVRIQTRENSYLTGKPRGIFASVHNLLNAGKLTDDEAKLFDYIDHDWFQRELPNPPFYGDDTPGKPITWFKTAATTHMLDKLQPLMEMLDKNGVPYDVVYTNAPGNVVYEDDWQVAVL